MQIYVKSVPVTNRLLKSRIKSGRVLDVGGAPMPSRILGLIDQGCKGAIVDISDPFQPLDPRIQFFRMRIEDLPDTGELFDHIVLSNVLEHVESSAQALQACSRILNPKGQIHVLTPNCETLNRRIGVKMGVLSSIREIPQKEKDIGHIHTFTVP